MDIIIRKAMEKAVNIYVEKLPEGINLDTSYVLSSRPYLEKRYHSEYAVVRDNWL